jgi:hypothetical protein
VAVQIWMLPSGSGGHLCSPLVALLWRWLFTVLLCWVSMLGIYFFCPAPFLWGRFSVALPPSPPAVSVWWQFTVYFSVLWGSLTLSAAYWFRR